MSMSGCAEWTKAQWAAYWAEAVKKPIVQIGARLVMLIYDHETDYSNHASTWRCIAYAEHPQTVARWLRQHRLLEDPEAQAIAAAWLARVRKES